MQSLSLSLSLSQGLSAALMRGFALSLRLDELWFAPKNDRHASSLRALNYPPLGPGSRFPAPPLGQLRASAHTDYGVLTVLKPGGPGLQVFLFAFFKKMLFFAFKTNPPQYLFFRSLWENCGGRVHRVYAQLFPLCVNPRQTTHQQQPQPANPPRQPQTTREAFRCSCEAGRGSTRRWTWTRTPGSWSTWGT